MFIIKQFLKMLLQHMVLPVIYTFWRIVYCRKEPQLIVFADAHHETFPYSMKNMYDALTKKGCSVVTEIHDYSKVSQLKSFCLAARFMKIYAQAKVVFICDNFFPVVSCNKSKKTKVVQLWHSCGLLKKMGYDTEEDIPKYYLGNVYKNYDLVTVSAPACEEHLTRAMRQKEGVVKALGVSRTDTYYDQKWIDFCKSQFYEAYPEAEGKKVILWAPTFRGNAGDPYQVGTEAIMQLEKELGEKYFVIRKVHPHIENRYHLSNCSIPSEQLFPVADLMITDYSSIVFDYLFFKKPYILFAPDMEEYLDKRGFYVEYESLCPYVITEEEKLKENVLSVLNGQNEDWIQQQYDFHISSCDGHVTERILAYLALD
ncbi:MAG: CDP-glycerol glycerophosphotransferase family protein [Lachnospiraceae bacterium]|nr:CDP-glycerol glycerophosphotransferase family protein [Lachnospiraceae bacterium]